MRTADFDYYIPPELIAQTPAEQRDHSRLMVLSRNAATVENHRFFELTDFLIPGDVMVLNDSRVIPARLLGRKAGTGGKVEVFLLRKLEKRLWETLVKPAKRLKVGARIKIYGNGEAENNHCLEGEVVKEGEEGSRVIRFSDDALLMKLGNVPLPPYIHTELEEPERYQTVYSRVSGSVAAPTAGLHFTQGMLDDIKSKGVELAFVTLHVGLGTFLPVREEDPRQHHIHEEYCELTTAVAAQLSCAKAEGRRIICVGTTSARILEQAASIATNGALMESFRGWTDFFILPGYKFRAVDVLLTNFHLPCSTLLMLVSAFAGEDFIRRAYREAIEQDYRFYSFGDAMLIT